MERIMLKRLGLLGILALAAAPAGAVCNGFSATPVNAFAFESITVSTTALGFTAATYAPSGLLPANMAIVTVETNPLRFRLDGLNPTAAIGHLAATSSSVEVCGTFAVSTIRMIRSGAADSTIMVSYYRKEQQ